MRATASRLRRLVTCDIYLWAVSPSPLSTSKPWPWLFPSGDNHANWDPVDGVGQISQGIDQERGAHQPGIEHEVPFTAVCISVGRRSPRSKTAIPFLRAGICHGPTAPSHLFQDSKLRLSPVLILLVFARLQLSCLSSTRSLDRSDRTRANHRTRHIRQVWIRTPHHLEISPRILSHQSQSLSRLIRNGAFNPEPIRL